MPNPLTSRLTWTVEEVRDEFMKLSAWIRQPGNINPQDAIDECARLMANCAIQVMVSGVTSSLRAEAHPSSTPPAETLVNISDANNEWNRKALERVWGAETPRETFIEEGWALRRRSDNAWMTTHGRGVGRIKLWKRQPDGREAWYPVYLTRTVTVQVHEPAPRSEP